MLKNCPHGAQAQETESQCPTGQFKGGKKSRYKIRYEKIRSEETYVLIELG